ncbi:hemicentin-1-like [Mytilus galloprovincialis]|uniref:hemicentin-1-like n=1 Tax=Mytilus galloprovincialis TaxID=29158 RepID=UPI003F7BB998
MTVFIFSMNTTMTMWLALLVLLVPVFCRQTIPSIVATPYQSVPYGTSAIVIQCTVSSSPVATSVGWRRVSLIDSTTEYIYASNSNGKYHITDSMINPHLTINNIVFSDENNYVCFATNLAGTGHSNNGKLNVTSEIPSIIATPQKQFPVDGSPKIIIECNISSSPTATSVGWQRTSLDGFSTRAIVVAISNGKYQVDNSLAFPHLTINDVSLADDAYYACFGNNVAGKGISNSVRVDVIELPLAVSVPVTEYSVSVGSKVSLQCVITSGTAIEVTWLKNNIIITMTNRLSGGTVKSPTLVINSVEQGDLGYYVCSASDGVMTVNSDDIFLIPSDMRVPLGVKVPKTQYSPVLFTNVILQCEVRGSVTSVKWFKNNNVISIANSLRFSGSDPNSPSLTINSVTEDDFGYYTCQISDGVDILNADIITLLPTGIPPVVFVPRHLPVPIRGQQYIIPCTIDSSQIPLQDVQWIYINWDGITIDPINITSPLTVKYEGSSVDSPSLVINDYQSSDDGRYMCRATNAWGNDVSPAVLVTLESVPTLLSVQSSYQSEPFTHVILRCTVNSVIPVIKVFWQRNQNGNILTISSDTNINKYSGSSPSTPHLTISDTNNGDAGSYICFAVNHAGTGNSPTIVLSITTNNVIPIVVVAESSYNVALGSSVTMVCTATFPLHITTNIVWERITDGSKTVIVPYTSKYDGGSALTPSLTIFYAEESDAGVYICYASNVFGVGHGTTELYVVKNEDKLKCPSGWIYNENSCYLFTITSYGIPWFGAKTFCEEHGAKLAEIETESEDKYILSNMKNLGSRDYFWLGGRDDEVEGSWKWSSGTPFTYTHWLPGEPNDNSGVYKQDYLMTNYAGWIDHPSSLLHVRHYVCEMVAHEINCPTDWLSFDNSCYLFMDSRNELDWFSADNACRENGTILAEIETEAEDEYIRNIIRNQYFGEYFWLGGRDDETEGSWKWSSGTPFNYSKWYSGQPDDAQLYEQDFLITNEKGWFDHEASYVRNHVCEMSSLSISAPVTIYSPTLYDSVTMVCVITSGTAKAVTWYKNKNLIDIPENGRLLGGNASIPSLTIISVEQNDLGYYTCHATDGRSTVNSRSILLTPKVPLLLSVNAPITKYSPPLASKVTLQCTITSGTAATLEWHFNNSPINVGDNSKYAGGNINNPSLTINSVKQNDLGYYMCVAINEIITVNTDTIALLPMGAKPIVKVPQTSYIQLAGQEITIICTIQSPKSPIQEVQWIFINQEGKRIDPVILSSTPLKYQGSTISNPSLTIMFLESSDAGQYSCRARSLIGSTVSDKSASLVIPEIPAVHISKSLYTVNLQDDLTLECTALSNIALRDVFWVKEINDTTTTVVIGNKFHGSSTINPSLTISDVDNNDEGHYTCYASNTIGIGSSLTTVLNVTGNANITITGLTVEGEMINGRSVTVMCEAYVLYAEGTIFATWKLNNSVINPTNTSRWKTETISSNPNNKRMQFRLIVLSLQTSDSGNLTCEVSDGYISSDKTLSLNIIGKPIVSVSPRTSTVSQGDTVNIYCNVVQSFSVLTSILWYKNGDTFNPNKGEIIIRIDNTHSKLVVSGVQDTVQYECSGINNYGEGNRLVSHISVIKPNVVYQYCPVNVDQFEGFWVYTVENTLVINSCPGDRAGTVSRLCNSNGDWEEPNYSTCIADGLLNLNVETDLLKNGIEVKDVNNILVDLNKLTEPDVPKDLTSGELDISSSILDNIASHAKERADSISIDQLEIFVSSCDNLLVEKNIPSWRQLKQLNFTGVTAIAKAVTVYTKAYTNINDSVFQRTVQKDQLVVQVGKVLHDDITFPKKTQVLPDWITESTNQVTLSKDNFEGKQPVGYSITYYRNISNLFHEYYLSEGSVVATNGSYDINSVVIDFSIEPTPTSLQRPLIIKFEHVQVNYSNPVCAFWDFDAVNTPNGAWSFIGSKLVTTSEGVTVCQYDHTTNFALLMSPGRAPPSHSLVLSKISAAGCGISILFLVVTVMIHAML